MSIMCRVRVKWMYSSVWGVTLTHWLTDSPGWWAPPSRCRCLAAGGCAPAGFSSGKPAPQTTCRQPSWPLPSCRHHCGRWQPPGGRDKVWVVTETQIHQQQAAIKAFKVWDSTPSGSGPTRHQQLVVMTVHDKRWAESHKGELDPGPVGGPTRLETKSRDGGVTTWKQSLLKWSEVGLGNLK